MGSPWNEATRHEVGSESCQSDPADAAGWAAIFVWGALVMLAESTNFSANFSGWNGWSVFFSGTGVIVLFGVVIRLLLLQHRRSVVGHVICGLVLLSLGLGDQVDWDWVWPSVMIAVAVVILQDASYRKPGLHALCGGSLKSPNTKDERETWHG
jgi:hypothetical protein